MNAHQFPSGDQVFLDHAGIFVPEFVRSGEALETLGFTVTGFNPHRSALAPGEPLTALGTGNRCIMLRTGYLEILGPTGEQTPMAAAMHEAMARYDGLHLIAFTAAKPARFHARLSDAGMQPLPLARIRRDHLQADGSIGEIGGTIVRLPPQAWPEGRVQMVFPEMAPEVMWQPHQLDHANGAIGLTEMLVAVDDPAARAEQFSRFTGKPVRQEGRSYVIALDRGLLYVTAVDDLMNVLPGAAIPAPPSMPAVAVEVEDLARTEAFLASRSIFSRRIGPTLQVAQHHALGASFVFHDKSESRPFATLLR